MSASTLLAHRRLRDVVCMCFMLRQPKLRMKPGATGQKNNHGHSPFIHRPHGMVARSLTVPLYLSTTCASIASQAALPCARESATLWALAYTPCLLLGWGLPIAAHAVRAQAMAGSVAFAPQERAHRFPMCSIPPMKRCGSHVQNCIVPASTASRHVE